MSATRCVEGPSTNGSRPARRRPTTTSYGEAPVTGTTVLASLSSMSHSCHCLANLGSHLSRRPAVGVHRQRRDRLIDGRALVEQRLDPRAHVPEQEWPPAAQSHPL